MENLCVESVGNVGMSREKKGGENENEHASHVEILEKILADKLWEKLSMCWVVGNWLESNCPCWAWRACPVVVQ